MKHLAAALLAGLGIAAAMAAAPSRPQVTGISHLAVFTTDPAGADHFYGTILGGRKAADPEDAKGVRYMFSGTQYVEVLPAPANHGPSMLAHVAYNTADAAGLRSYLVAHGLKGAGAVQTGADGSRWFSTRDPEGNEVRFVQTSASDTAEGSAISGRIIHVGYLVHSREAQDRFYRQLLGFRPYWYGAMKENAVDWVSQQVPDGRDWLEYMLVGPGTTTPLSKVDAHQLGVLNHLSLGVPNMEAAVTRLYAEDRLSPRHDGPQMGKDGKWQANLYDPDGTRVELMEFKPVTKPCCSAFTAESPER